MTASALTVLLLVVMAAVLVVLIIGLVSMAKGGEFNKKYGNKLMRLRVVLQGVALLVLALILVSR